MRSEAGSETESESVLLPLISPRIQHELVLLVVLTVFATGFRLLSCNKALNLGENTLSVRR